MRGHARRCKAAGTSIVFITHKLREVRAVADRITVIRRGKVVGEASPDVLGGRAGLDDGRPPGAGSTIDKDAGAARRRGPRRRGRSGSSTTRAQVARRRRQLLGAGRRDLRPGRCPGQRPDRAHRGAGRAGPRSSQGRITLDGHGRHQGRRSTTCSSSGVGYVPEDRLHDGLVGSFSVAENLVLDLYDQPPFANGHALDLDAIRQNATDAGRRVRRPHAVDRAARVHPVRRQPAEGRARPRAVPAAEAADRRAADPGPRRRLDGVRAPADRGRARQRRRRHRWSPPSSTRCSASPTGSASCTAGKIIGEVARRHRRRARSAC